MLSTVERLQTSACVLSLCDAVALPTWGGGTPNKAKRSQNSIALENRGETTPKLEAHKSELYKGGRSYMCLEQNSGKRGAGVQ